VWLAQKQQEGQEHDGTEEDIEARRMHKENEDKYTQKKWLIQLM
jgi:hypothetical protein